MNKVYLEKIVIYSDGACSGNPGPGGWGSLLGLKMSDNEEKVYTQVVELGGGDRSTTNNRMEMTASLQALVSLSQWLLQQKNILDTQSKLKEICIYTDSVYVIKGITQWIFGWKRNGWKNSSGDLVTNQDIWVELDQVVNAVQRQIPQSKLSWQYVRGHKGIHGNERCDEIAVAFSKGKSCFLYEGSNQDYKFDLFKPPATEPLPEGSWDKSKKSSATSWYLVLRNGVLKKYDTWKECEAQVKGVPGVRFKKVSSEAEEATVLQGWGFSQ